MTWRDNIKPGQIGDVPFFTVDAPNEFGIRAVVHEFPLNDEPFVEPLGKKKRAHRITGFLIGDDYMDLRDRLAELSESGQPQQLTHYFLGRMTVIILSFDPNESTRRRGQCDFTLDVIRAGVTAYPTTTEKTEAAVLTAVNDSFEPVVDGFLDSFDLSLSSVLQTHAQQLTDTLDRGLAGMLDKLPVPVGVAVHSALGAGEVLLLSGNPLAALLPGVPTAQTLIDGVVNVMSGSTGLLGRVLKVGTKLLRPGALEELSVSLSVFGGSYADIGSLITTDLGFTAEPTRTPQRVTPLALVKSLSPSVSWPATSATTDIKVQAANNQSALQTAVEQLSVLEQARLSAALDYPTQADAYAVRDYLSNRLATLAKTADDGMYSRLLAVRTAVRRDLTARGGQLAGVTAFTPRATLPALVLSHQLYGNALREAEIIERNPRLEHPGFVPGGEPIEVLSE